MKECRLNALQVDQILGRLECVFASLSGFVVCPKIQSQYDNLVTFIF